MNDVIRQCVDVIVKNADIVFKSDAFFKLSSGALELVIKSDDLVMPEVDIFYCCVKWAKVQLKKQECDVTGDTLRRMLGNVLRCIRFPLMPSSSFASAITAYAVLTDDEELSVYRSIAKRDAHIFLTPDNTHMTFSSVPRKVTQTLYMYHSFHYLISKVPLEFVGWLKKFGYTPVVSMVRSNCLMLFSA